MNERVQGGLVLVGVSAALLYAWWSGAFVYFIEQAAGRAGPSFAGGGQPYPIAPPAPPSGGGGGVTAF